MGNREALLEGALRCLQEQGFARTTARDIVAAAGTNLGAIGYHYGSTERLLNTALLAGFERWYAELAETAARAAHDSQPLAVISAALPQTFERNRPLVRAWAEALAQAEHSVEVRDGLREAYERGRELALELLPGADATTEAASDPARRAVGSLLLAIFDGLLIQWLLDPAKAPNSEQLAAIAAALAPALP
jgi:AcrR family transcriptional regulator